MNPTPKTEKAPEFRTRKATDVDVFVGERIREIRINAGLTQMQLAAILGSSHQQLQKYESGTNRISAGRLFSVAEALGLPVETFFPGADAPKSVPLPPKARERLTRAADAIRDLLS